MIDSYQGGYTKALLDVRDFFEYHNNTLKHNRMYNSKMIFIVLNGLINARHKMMEIGGRDLTMRLSKDRKELSLYED